MTRKKLEELGDTQRYTFVGVFVRTGTKSGWKGATLDTILLRDIRLKDKPDEILTDHLWFNYTRGFIYAGISVGDLVQFDGRVCGYWHGYFGHRSNIHVLEGYDFKISYPSNIKVISKEELYQKKDGD